MATSAERESEQVQPAVGSLARRTHRKPVKHFSHRPAATYDSRQHRGSESFRRLSARPRSTAATTLPALRLGYDNSDELPAAARTLSPPLSPGVGSVQPMKVGPLCQSVIVAPGDGDGDGGAWSRC